MKKTINDITEEDMDKWFQSPAGQEFLHKLKSYDDMKSEKKRHRVKKFFKRLFCDHDWQDGSHMPYGQSFVCSKCGKEFWWYPE